MATIAQSMPPSSHPWSWIGEFLKEELAPRPGRAALAARMTITATLIMILTMTFRIPYGAYGAIYAFNISRESPEVTVNAVKTIIVAFVLSVLYILIGARFFLQEPDLRLIWVIATLFVLFYALSAAANYTAAARFGYLLVITIPLWDSQISTEDKVEQTLWAFGAISLASLITVAIELIYAEWKTRDVILQPIVERLADVEELLSFYAAGSPPDEKTKKQITRLVLVGNSALRRTLQRSPYSPQYREQIGALIALVGRLMDIAANLIQLDIEIPEHERTRVRTLAANIGKIRSDLVAGGIPQPDLASASESLQAFPLLGEMETAVSQIPEMFAGSRSLDASAPSHPGRSSTLSLFKADALTNPEHIKFALKGCLAASICYLIYNGKAWPGISTALTTCLLTALTTIGSSRQKQVLRIGGAIVGGVILGIGSEVFILPSLDSIAGFTLVFIVATVIAAWFATSSPRLSYFGVQIAVAFYLINLSEFKVQTSLIPARDRVIGILLGLVSMWLVFDQLWGASAAVEMRKAFISNLRLMAQFAREPVSKDMSAAIERNHSLRETINGNFDKVRALADGVLLEFGRSREQDLALRNHIRQWQSQVRVLFINCTVLWRYGLSLPGFELPDAIRTAREEFDHRLAKAFDGMADRLKGGGSPQSEDVTAAYTQLVQVAGHALPNEEDRLTPHVQSFLLLSRRVAALADTLQREL
jgi:multidrug resistance protein MdtO